MRAAIRAGAFAIGALAILIARPAPAPAAAQAPEAYGEEGVRASILLPRASIGGDFDGRTIHTIPNAVLMLPKIDPGWGIGAAAGHRGRRYALEFGYQRTDHDATLPNAVGTTAKFETYNIDFRYYFFEDKRYQPFLLVGWIPYARLTVKNASRDAAGSVQRGVFRSKITGANLGAGVEAYATRKVSVSATLYYRLLTFEEANGVREWPKIKDTGYGYTFLMGAGYTF